MFHDVIPENLSGGEARARRFSLEAALAIALLAGGLLAIYLPGMGNALVFDDTYLTDGLFTDYATPFAAHPRLLSYGSFVWLHALMGEGWWKQRLVNLLLHFATVAALWGFYREILRHIVRPAADHDAAGADLASSPALPFAIGFFALNPMAVYAVAYLIQRSILMATLFVVLGLWTLARGVAAHRPWLLVAALGCYLLAVAAKENAILAPLAALPVYIVVARPSRARLVSAAFADLALVGCITLLLWQHYGQIIGKPFDEYSFVYLAQLGPEAKRHAFGLSVLNESWLFFRYGVDWMLPWSGWMSINLRPPFPISFLSFPHLLGPPAYAALVLGGFRLVLGHRDWRALLGLAILLPALLYPTEYSTVWVQDPFVLYRSYLWAIGIPGVVFLLVHGTSARALLALGSIVAALLVWQSLDRVFSLENPEVAWTDAIAKLPDDPRSVGRWFPYLNRGAIYADRDSFDLALHDFEASASLGDHGMGAFNMGSVLSAKGRQQEALAAFDRAEKEGYGLYNLPFQRGMALLALHRTQAALHEFERTRAMHPPSPMREINLLQIGKAAMQLGQVREAIEALEPLAGAASGNREARYLLGMAYIMSGEPARARTLLDKLLLESADGSAFYARALANYGLKRKAEALSDIDNALRFAPDNRNLREWRAKIAAMP